MYQCERWFGIEPAVEIRAMMGRYTGEDTHPCEQGRECPLLVLLVPEREAVA